MRNEYGTLKAVQIALHFVFAASWLAALYFVMAKPAKPLALNASIGCAALIFFAQFYITAKLKHAQGAADHHGLHAPTAVLDEDICAAMAIGEHATDIAHDTISLKKACND